MSYLTLFKKPFVSMLGLERKKRKKERIKVCFHFVFKQFLMLKVFFFKIIKIYDLLIIVDLQYQLSDDLSAII